MREKIRRILDKRPGRRQEPEKVLEQAIQGLPRITNETVAEHREAVLSSARKYIYPLKHSAHRVVIISSTLLVCLVVAFFSYCVVALYKFQSSSSFIYRVTQVIPFPVAKAGSRYVSYESYLFELRHYVHYYQTQQQVDFSSESGRQQLAEFRQQAMNIVIDDAYVKEIAAEHHIVVTNAELQNAINLVRSQNRLGSNNQAFEDVLQEFWGWSIADFKTELQEQLLAQKVVFTLDVGTHNRAEAVYQQLQQGADFATLVKQYSDDTSTKNDGGDYGFNISQTDPNLPPQVTAALFKLKPGQISSIINTGTSLEIVKLESVSGSEVTAAHIEFNFVPIGTYINPLRAEFKPETFISP
jgi:hypothetical protein